jgi:hypothetical protein
VCTGPAFPRKSGGGTGQEEKEIGPRPTSQASADATRPDGKHQNGGGSGKDSPYCVPLERSTVRAVIFLRVCGGAFPSRRRQFAYRNYWVRELRPHRSQEHRPVRRGAPNRKVEVYEEKFPTRKSHVTDSGYKGPGVAPEHRGGRRDKRQLSWDQSLESGTPPSVVTLTQPDTPA